MAKEHGRPPQGIRIGSARLPASLGGHKESGLEKVCGADALTTLRCGAV